VTLWTRDEESGGELATSASPVFLWARGVRGSEATRRVQDRDGQGGRMKDRVPPPPDRGARLLPRMLTLGGAKQANSFPKIRATTLLS
jgi:hypothetical protein